MGGDLMDRQRRIIRAAKFRYLANLPFTLKATEDQPLGP